MNYINKGKRDILIFLNLIILIRYKILEINMMSYHKYYPLILLLFFHLK